MSDEEVKKPRAPKLIFKTIEPNVGPEDYPDATIVEEDKKVESKKATTKKASEENN